MAQAQQVKLEAKAMELELTMDQINKLEQKMKFAQRNNEAASVAVEDLERDMKLLELKLEAIENGEKVPAVSNGNVSNNNGNINGNKMEDGQGPATSSVTTSALSEDRLESAILSFRQLPPYMRRRLAEIVGLYDGDALTNVDPDDDPFVAAQVVLALYENRVELASGSPFEEQRKKRVQIQVQKPSMDGSGRPQLIEVNSTDELLSYLNEIESEMNSDESRRERFISSMYPEATRKGEFEPSEEQALEFMESVLSTKTFSPKSKPEKIPGGYLIRGTNVMSSNEKMISSVQEQLDNNSNLSDKIQFHYLRDPYPGEEEPVEFEDIWGEPVMLVLAKDVSPERNQFVATLTTLISLACIGIFSVEAFSATPDVMSHLQASYDSGDSDLSWLTPRVIPIFFYFLATQLAHEIGHQLFALKGKFKTCAPTFIPSPTLPLLTAVTKIRTPPKSYRDLFDFALAGPLSGFFVSIGLLLFGLVQTNTIDAASYDLLPTLPVDLIKASSLGGNIIDALTSNQVLGSMAAKDLPLHPAAIAGFCGMIINALCLLPIGQSDGGRIATAVFGRNGIVLAQAFTYFAVFGAAIFGYDEANILGLYALFSVFAQRELEVPCVNEIDDLDLGRSFLAIFGSVVVALTLIPIK